MHRLLPINVNLWLWKIDNKKERHIPDPPSPESLFYADWSSPEPWACDCCLDQNSELRWRRRCCVLTSTSELNSCCICRIPEVMVHSVMLAFCEASLDFTLMIKTTLVRPLENFPSLWTDYVGMWFVLQNLKNSKKLLFLTSSSSSSCMTGKDDLPAPAEDLGPWDAFAMSNIGGRTSYSSANVWGCCCCWSLLATLYRWSLSIIMSSSTIRTS